MKRFMWMDDDRPAVGHQTVVNGKPTIEKKLELVQKMEIIHAGETVEWDVAGHPVGEIRSAGKHPLNIGNQAVAYLDGERVEDDVVVLDDHSTLEFMVIEGHKGVGRVWTPEEYCQLCGISREQLDQQIEEGLKVMRLADGTMRITETAVDDFISGGRLEPSVVSLIATSLERIANHFDPPPPNVVDSGYIADKLGCTKVWVARMAADGEVPRNAILPGTGNGKPWKFYRSLIDRWIERR